MSFACNLLSLPPTGSLEQVKLNHLQGLYSKGVPANPEVLGV